MVICNLTGHIEHSYIVCGMLEMKTMLLSRLVFSVSVQGISVQ